MFRCEVGRKVASGEPGFLQTRKGRFTFAANYVDGSPFLIQRSTSRNANLRIAHFSLILNLDLAVATRGAKSAKLQRGVCLDFCRHARGALRFPKHGVGCDENVDTCFQRHSKKQTDVLTSARRGKWSEILKNRGRWEPMFVFWRKI